MARKSRNNNDDGSGGGNCGGRRCCLIVILLSLLVVAGGLLLWFFVLDEEQKENLPQVNLPGLGETEAPTTSPAPTAAPWSAIQCDNGNDNSDFLCCQGSPELCTLRADEAVYAYMHNAMATKADDFGFPWNHDESLEQALEQGGFRAFELDVGRCGGDGSDNSNDIVFFHGMCELGWRDVNTVFESMHTFLEAHPSEIVWLFLQMNEEEPEHDVTLQELDDLIPNVLQARLYQHALGEPWPTLREMVQADTRLVIVYWNQPACSNQPNGCPAGFQAYFDVGVETSFSYARTNDIWNDGSRAVEATSCELRDFGQTGTRDLFKVNSFLQLPSSRAATTLNAPEVVTARLETCENVANQKVNFYSVDFWSVGEVGQVVLETNRERAAAAARRG